MKLNPLHKNNMDCLYVGSTSHTCACRFKQHQLHIKKGVDGYVCICDGTQKLRAFVRAGGHTKGSYYPGAYGLRLRPDLFYSYNPIMNKNNAMIREKKLAESLRSQGYAVWQH